MSKYTRKGQTKEVLPEEDEFVSFWERAWQVVEPQLRNIAIAAAVIVALPFIAWGITSITTGSKEDATAAFERAVRIHEAELLPDDTKTDDAAKDPKAVKPADKVAKAADGEDELPRFKTSEERAKATLDALDKLEKSHGGSDVTKQARSFRAGVLFELGRYDEAKKVAGEFGADAGKNNPLGTIAKESEGLSLETQGKLDEALAIYGDLADRGPDFFRERALFDKARILVKKGDKGGAKDAYKKILEKVTTGPLHDEANQRMTALGG